MNEAVEGTPKAEIGLVLYPGCQTAMVHGMTDLLDIASQFSIKRGGRKLRVSHWRPGGDGSWSRVSDTHPDLSSSMQPAVLIVPGRLTGPMGADEAAPYARWLLDRHAQGATLAANCGGVFALAATGLLSGRSATTHWLFADSFRSRFPDVQLDTDRMVIEDGDIITAGGLMAWTDLGLRLVDRFLGSTVMADTGSFMLIDAPGREQRYYSRFSPRLTHGDEAILKVQHWLHARDAKTISIAEMARTIAMEERTFQRRFKAATGMKPTEYAQHLRVGKARELLEFTRRPVEQVAYAVGYEDPAAFRRLFHRVVGLSPGDYRTRFAAAAAG
jgi:transcriptional regulator GlxA family with amidase domain